VLGEVREACASVSSFPGGGQLACEERLSREVELMNGGLGVAGGKGLGGDVQLDSELYFRGRIRQTWLKQGRGEVGGGPEFGRQ
jgi:hypothetical protein